MDVYLTDINDVVEFHSIAPTFTTPPTQPVGLANVTAVEGSAVVTVEISGTVDTGGPVLRMAMAGTFTPTAAVPGIVSPLALTALVSALIATGGGWLLRVRSRFA